MSELVITVHTYNTDPNARELADSLIEEYGQDKMLIDQMIVSDSTVSFHIKSEGWFSYDR